MRERLQNFPISFFAVVMGLTGATIAWKRLANPSWWAYTFPLAALTISTIFMYHHNPLAFYKYLALVLLILLSCVVLMLAVMTLGVVKNRKTCVED